MKLFVTGGTGFIGGHFLNAALAAGHEVRALRRSLSSQPSIPLQHQPIWFEGDLFTLKSEWLNGVDAVVHLASAGVSPQQASWSKLFEVNVLGSLKLLELIADMEVPRIVMAGTSHEYGNAACRYENGIPPDSPLEPITAYAASKAASYQLVSTFAKSHSIELFYGRIFSAYGEGQFPGNFWPSLRKAAQSGSDFSMTSGQQISDFIPVGDVAKHLLKACIRLDIEPSTPLVVNIGSGISRSLLSFAQSEWQRLGAIGNLLPGTVAARQNFVSKYVPDLVGL
jgi:UDP-glucose 4-epimerase